MAVVMFAPPIAVCRIFTVEILMTLPFRMGQDQMYIYTNRKPISNFLCVYNINVCLVCHRLGDNHV